MGSASDRPPDPTRTPDGMRPSRPVLPRIHPVSATAPKATTLRRREPPDPLDASQALSSKAFASARFSHQPRMLNLLSPSLDPPNVAVCWERSGSKDTAQTSGIADYHVVLHLDIHYLTCEDGPAC